MRVSETSPALPLIFGSEHERDEVLLGLYGTVWTSLMVLPEVQERGIGSSLTYGLETRGADKRPVWLVTQMRGRELYRKFGFDDADVLDIDLSEYAGSHRGFGSHRSICMIRQPRDAKSLGSEVYSKMVGSERNNLHQKSSKQLWTPHDLRAAAPQEKLYVPMIKNVVLAAYSLRRPLVCISAPSYNLSARTARFVQVCLAHAKAL